MKASSGLEKRIERRQDGDLSQLCRVRFRQRPPSPLWWRKANEVANNFTPLVSFLLLWRPLLAVHSGHSVGHGRAFSALTGFGLFSTRPSLTCAFPSLESVAAFSALTGFGLFSTVHHPRYGPGHCDRDFQCPHGLWSLFYRVHLYACMVASTDLSVPSRALSLFYRVVSPTEKS